MPSPGEIYLAEHPAGQKHPFLIVSRDELNRGKRVIGVNITSVDVERRSAYPNCIPIAAGKFGLSKDSVIQCENVVALNRVRLEATPIGKVDRETVRDVIKALGYVFDADCEPT
jgi:mRNA-degrading endonuclease toxin of MazEF toxin-antitoxin module